MVPMTCIRDMKDAGYELTPLEVIAAVCACMRVCTAKHNLHFTSFQATTIRQQALHFFSTFPVSETNFHRGWDWSKPVRSGRISKFSYSKPENENRSSTTGSSESTNSTSSSTSSSTSTTTTSSSSSTSASKGSSGKGSSGKGSSGKDSSGKDSSGKGSNGKGSSGKGKGVSRKRKPEESRSGSGRRVSKRIRYSSSTPDTDSTTRTASTTNYDVSPSLTGGYTEDSITWGGDFDNSDDSGDRAQGKCNTQHITHSAHHTHGLHSTHTGRGIGASGYGSASGSEHGTLGQASGKTDLASAFSEGLRTVAVPELQAMARAISEGLTAPSGLIENSRKHEAAALLSLEQTRDAMKDTRCVICDCSEGQESLVGRPTLNRHATIHTHARTYRDAMKDTRDAVSGFVTAALTEGRKSSSDVDDALKDALKRNSDEVSNIKQTLVNLKEKEFENRSKDNKSLKDTVIEVNGTFRTTPPQLTCPQSHTQVIEVQHRHAQKEFDSRNDMLRIVTKPHVPAVPQPGMYGGMYGAVQQPGMYGAVQQPGMYGGMYGAVQQPGMYGAVQQPGMYGAVQQPGMYGAVQQPGMCGAVQQPGMCGAVQQPGGPMYGAVQQPGGPMYGAVQQPGGPMYGAVQQPGGPMYGAVQQPGMYGRCPDPKCIGMLEKRAGMKRLTCEACWNWTELPQQPGTYGPCPDPRCTGVLEKHAGMKRVRCMVCLYSEIPNNSSEQPQQTTTAAAATSAPV
jgi:hypothetical protein